MTQGDAVLIDRNCHKSVQHGLSMTGSIPVYLRPPRNGYGIIGPIALDQLQPGGDRRGDRPRRRCVAT